MMRLPKMKPMAGHAIVELQPAADKSDGGIAIPDEAQEKPNEAIVRSLGEPPKGGWDCVLGDRVVVRKHLGTQLDIILHRKLKLVSHHDILAVFV